MMEVLERAVEKVRELPNERQAYAAEVLEHIAAGSHGAFLVPASHRSAIEEGLAQAHRGELLDEKVANDKLRRPWD